jgi:hypothetical protein
MSDDIIAQPTWHWCDKCGNLWHASSANPTGFCAAAPNHKHSQTISGDYVLFAKPKPSPPFKSTLMAQTQWRWCSKCNGLWHNTTAVPGGVCPGGGTHTQQGSGDYTLLNDSSGSY